MKTFSGVEESLLIQLNSLHSPPPPTHTHTWLSEDKSWVVYHFPRVQSLEEFNCECNLKNQSQPHSSEECDKWEEGIVPLPNAQSGVSHSFSCEKGGRREVGGWRGGTELSFLQNNPYSSGLCPPGFLLFTWWANPGRVWVVWLVYPRQRRSCGWDRLSVWCWNCLEEQEEPESGHALVISGKEGRKEDSRS